jgi:hypothetical protein
MSDYPAVNVLVLDETDHLVVEGLCGGVGLVVLQERLEVELVGHLLRLVPSQPGPPRIKQGQAVTVSLKAQLYKQLICTFILL